MSQRTRYTQKGLYGKHVGEDRINEVITAVLKDRYYMRHLDQRVVDNLRSESVRSRRRGYDAVCAFEARLVREGMIQES
jgi:hypothetical protein